MMRSAEEDGLLLQWNTRFATLEDPLDHIRRPDRCSSRTRDERRLLSRRPVGDQILGEALGRKGDDGVRGIEDGWVER